MEKEVDPGAEFVHTSEANTNICFTVPRKMTLLEDLTV